MSNKTYPSKLDQEKADHLYRMILGEITMAEFKEGGVMADLIVTMMGAVECSPAWPDFVNIVKGYYHVELPANGSSVTDWPLAARRPSCP